MENLKKASNIAPYILKWLHAVYVYCKKKYEGDGDGDDSGGDG